MKLTISVVIPTYNRVDTLVNCIEGIRRQARFPDEIVIVVRNSDHVTLQYLSSLDLNVLKIALVERGGMIAALNAGILKSTGAIVALTDDDTVPHPDWLLNMERHYIKRPDVGGVGGRDIVHHGGKPVPPQKRQVGMIRPYGRIIGNHHIGMGDVREVDILKGANMSFRREAIRGLSFDEKLKGTGAQIHNELEFSQAVKKKGWKLLYDPNVLVDHFPAVRFDEDQRHSFNETAFFNAAHNETYAMLKHMRFMNRIMFLIWVVAVGSKSSPGVVQGMRMLPSQKGMALKKVSLAFKGRWGGWKTWKGSLE